MVDGTTLQCEGTVVTSFQLRSQKIYSSFYVVKEIDCGVLGTDILSTLEVQIDDANRKLFLKEKKRQHSNQSNQNQQGLEVWSGVFAK